MTRRLPILALSALAAAGCASSTSSSSSAVASAAAPPSVPAPAAVLGFEPGADRRLPEWRQVVDYFQRLDRASPRVALRTLGPTTMGRPFVAAFIADSATIANLPRYQEIQRRLADARSWRAGERERFVADGKAVVLVTSSIHSTEVGGFLTPIVLAHRLAAGEDAETRMIRDSTLVILVPSLNPDGVDIVGDWYRATLGTPHEGTPPPELYHKYVGHDNNRDWYAFTQAETRLTVDSLHNAWFPQVVNDIHQQGANGSRIFMPPYVEPYEPNVDPLIQQGVNELGRAMAARMVAEGKSGIVTDAIYDAWTPSRAYQHYRGGIRILTETASARLATPISLPLDSLRPGRGYDPRVVSANYTKVWPGGRWTIGDIVDYQTSASWALLGEVARHRTRYLDRFATVSAHAAQGRRAPGRADWPSAFVLPRRQADEAALRTLVRTLQRGQVEVREAREAFSAGGATHPAGSYVVFTAQPYGAWAKALLERQRYPDLRDARGQPIRPYDVTAHTLPLLMGVEVAALADSVAVPVSAPLPMIEEPRYFVEGLSAGGGALINQGPTRRIALYRSWSPSMDEGWTRWVFERYGIPYTRIVDRDVRAGGLRDRFDVIVLPDQSPQQIERGLRAGMYPDSLAGGLGAPGAASLRAFVEAGGTLVALNEASDYAIRALALPVRDALQGVNPRDFYAPGSVFRVTLDRSHPVASRMTAQPAIWFEDSPAFEITDSSRAASVATYPAGDPLLSGWLLGADRLAGRSALVDVTLGRGHVILFGFRPQYRGQTMATYPLLWGAMMR